MCGVKGRKDRKERHVAPSPAPPAIGRTSPWRGRIGEDGRGGACGLTGSWLIVEFPRREHDGEVWGMDRVLSRYSFWILSGCAEVV
jgi:hypothetical protein